MITANLRQNSLIVASLAYRASRKILARRRYYKLNSFIFRMAARNLGLLNHENDEVSGEHRLLQRIAPHWRHPVIVDVGANVGKYSSKIKRLCPGARCYAFEPHPATFEKLLSAGQVYGFEAINAACGASLARMKLYDYGASPGSEHASLYSDVIAMHGAAEIGSWDINVTTVDDFVASKGISQIDLLKIDTEGHEFDVLRGSEACIGKGIISVIHFEFNEMNVVSRVFLRDFAELLKDYRLYRMMPDGLIPLEPYNSLLHELFGYQNIAALRRDLAPDLEATINS